MKMWSFVGSKKQQRWLWHAIDHHTGRVLAYVCGPREDEMFLKLKALLAPFGITHFYTDGSERTAAIWILPSTRWGNSTPRSI